MDPRAHVEIELLRTVDDRASARLSLLPARRSGRRTRLRSEPQSRPFPMVACACRKTGRGKRSQGRAPASLRNHRSRYRRDQTSITTRRPDVRRDLVRHPAATDEIFVTFRLSAHPHPNRRRVIAVGPAASPMFPPRTPATEGGCRGPPLDWVSGWGLTRPSVPSASVGLLRRAGVKTPGGR